MVQIRLLVLVLLILLASHQFLVLIDPPAEDVEIKAIFVK